jgi:hypothetical protein
MPRGRGGDNERPPRPGNNPVAAAPKATVPATPASGPQQVQAVPVPVLPVRVAPAEPVHVPVLPARVALRALVVRVLQVPVETVPRRA